MEENNGVALAPTYRVIEGDRVDLLEPFPPAEVERIWGWMKSFKSLVETDDSPHTKEEFVQELRGNLPWLLTYAIVDKHNEMKRKHEHPLAGIVAIEPEGRFAAKIHIATCRSAFGKRLADEGVKDAIADAWAQLPDCSRLTAFINANNVPAISLAKRVGFRIEGKLRDAIVQFGEPKDAVIMGLTRRAALAQE